MNLYNIFFVTVKTDRHVFCRAFTLVELLIVVALVGALVIGLLATIDPFEQLKRGRDNSKQSISVDINNALIRIFGIKGSFPVDHDLSGVKLDTVEGLQILQAVGQAGELKENFPKYAGKNLSSIYLTVAKDGSRVIVCFTPESKAFSSHDNAYYTASGDLVDDCTTESCYACVGNGLATRPGGSGSDSGGSETEPSPTVTPVSTLTSTPTPTVSVCSTDPVPPPTVSISTPDSVVTAGTPFTITVSAYSCAGLAAVWWYGAGGPDADAILSISYPATPTSSQMFTVPFTNPTKLTRAYGSPYFAASQSIHNYSFTSTLTIPTPGTYIFGANSRDVLYPIPGQSHQASEGIGLQFLDIQVVGN